MAEKKSTKSKSKKTEFEGMTVADAQKELQKTFLDVRTGEETDTSKIKKLKKQIAREKTKQSNKEQKI
jgi:ribosomal protein L29